MVIMINTNSEQLKLLLKEKENLTLEFKEKYSSRIDEDIVAFANTKGGIILLGVDDNGNVKGEELTNDLKAKINTLTRNCKPSISVNIRQIEKIVVLEIPEGDIKPYSCSTGYFRRLDGNTQKMDTEELKILFQKSDKIPFEENVEVGGRTYTPLRSGGDAKIIMFRASNGNLNCRGSSSNSDVEIVFEKETMDSDYIYGYVCYWDKEKVPFIGKQMIYGAIFTDEYDTFKTLSELSFERLKNLVDLYIERTGDNEVLQKSFEDLKIALDKDFEDLDDSDLRKIYDAIEQLNHIHYLLVNERGKYVY